MAGRRVVVTGAGSGIGRATALLLAAEGASLTLVDRDAAGLAETAARAGGLTVPLDITDEAAAMSALDEAGRAMGGIDGLVHAAGIVSTGRAPDVPAAEFRRLVDVNLTGTYIATRACLPWLSKASGATVVTIASAAGLLPNGPGVTAYAASKGGVVALSRAFAAELAPAIRVNCVCPGLVDTPMAEGHRGSVDRYALKRLADPAEIAQAILFLTSAESSYVTGSVLAVDGGRTFH